MTSGTDGFESYSLFAERDLPNGYDLRLAAYKMAWSRCLQRVQVCYKQHICTYAKREQELIHALHTPIVDKVAELVNKAYTDTLPGLPYPEVPVISVTSKHSREMLDVITKQGTSPWDFFVHL